MLAALGFALAAIAATSLSLVWFSSLNARVSVEPEGSGSSKAKRGTLLRLDSGRGRWLRPARFHSTTFPAWKPSALPDHPCFELALRPVCAGKFDLATIRLDVTDVYGSLRQA